MFETHEPARLPPNPFFALEEGAHRWAYICQTSNHEWFFVTHETSDEEITVSQQFMIPIPQYVLGFASRDTPNAFIREIQLVSPPWLNETGAWLMEPIRAIHKIGERFCYELADGRFYPSDVAISAGESLWTKNEQYR